MFIEFYLNFIHFNDFFNIDNDIFLKKNLEKSITRLKVLYDTRKDFIVLKNAKKYLFKLNNNQRANYQLKIFKTISTRIVINMIKKTFSITTITSITRVILIIDTTIISTIKSKQKTTFKKSICYNYKKIDYYKKDYTIQKCKNQIMIIV